MRRHKNLYPRIISFQNLMKAARLAERCKRFKFATARFNFFLEKELWQLHRELETKTYGPGGYYHFLIFEPKKRLISAAPYRDRVVHHAIHNILDLNFPSECDKGGARLASIHPSSIHPSSRYSYREFDIAVFRQHLPEWARPFH